MQLSWIYFKSR